MMGCDLIVHADDLGLSEPVNSGILEAHRNGIVTSCSLMATGAAFDHAVGIMASAPTLDIGVHLTLVEERPLSKLEDIGTLVDQEGCFFKDATQFIKRYMLGQVSLDEVRLELDLQISKILDHGIHVSHLDSHQHIHMLPGIRGVVGRLAKKYGIRAIRYPKERLRPYMFRANGTASRLLQLAALNAFCTVAHTSKQLRPDHFVGFFFGGRLNEVNLRCVLENLPPNGTCELMCHPGQPDPSVLYRHWHYSWADELNALTDKSLRRSLDDVGVKLISYVDLPS
jgi:predicted glycoside hydrolase/deacetylase ChbG (UPF0249 family)